MRGFGENNVKNLYQIFGENREKLVFPALFRYTCTV